MWDEIATRIPRTQHNGTLAMPGNSKEAVDLEKLHDTFPKLPFIEPQPAQKRALALLKTSKDGQWNSELMKKSASFYQAEAANIQIVLCMQKQGNLKTPSAPQGGLGMIPLIANRNKWYIPICSV